MTKTEERDLAVMAYMGRMVYNLRDEFLDCDQKAKRVEKDAADVRGVAEEKREELRDVCSWLQEHYAPIVGTDYGTVTGVELESPLTPGGTRIKVQNNMVYPLEVMGTAIAGIPSGGIVEMNLKTFFANVVFAEMLVRGEISVLLD